MWKKLALMVLILTLISVFTIPTAEAGSRKRILKALALGGLLAALPPPPVFMAPATGPYISPPRQEVLPGHWEITREWVPGTWERVWIPGNYDQWGYWVTGHYKLRKIPGRCVEGRVS